MTQLQIAIQQQMQIRISLLAYLLLCLGCLAQDALIAPKEPFTMSINQSTPVTDSFLIEVNSDNFQQDWGSIFSHFSSSNTDAVVEVDFSVVYKEDPTQTFQALNRCRFEGAAQQWCKVGQRSPPLNPHFHLIKAKLDCAQGCQFSVKIGHTSNNWNGKDHPVMLGAPTIATGALSTTKTEAIMKIGGWMLITLLLIMGAIQLAVRVADWVDEKSDKAQKHRKRE